MRCWRILDDHRGGCFWAAQLYPGTTVTMPTKLVGLGWHPADITAITISGRVFLCIRPDIASVAGIPSAVLRCKLRVGCITLTEVSTANSRSAGVTATENHTLNDAAGCRLRALHVLYERHFVPPPPFYLDSLFLKVQGPTPPSQRVGWTF